MVDVLCERFDLLVLPWVATWAESIPQHSFPEPDFGTPLLVGRGFCDRNTYLDRTQLHYRPLVDEFMLSPMWSGLSRRTSLGIAVAGQVCRGFKPNHKCCTGKIGRAHV